MDGKFFHNSVRGAGGGGGGKGGGGGGEARVAVEDPNTLRSRSTARILEIYSAGECEGLVNGAKSIFFDDTPLQDASGRYNFSGVNFDQRTGLPDQSYMPGYVNAESTRIVNAEVTNATPVIRTISGPADAARVTIRIPQLTFQDTTNGDLRGASVRFKIFHKASSSGTWVEYRDVTITGKTVSPYEVSYRVPAHPAGSDNDWDIKIERVTADATQVNIQNKTFWSGYAIITDGKFKYPRRAYVGIEVDAQQFGSSVPVRSYLVKGIKVQVPQNYDPITRVYTGIWNGTFKTAWTDNPAWVLYYLLTNKEEGLGESIASAQVDKWSLYNIAQYCDQLVPDGFGGFEPRYRFNYQITSREDAYRVLQACASVFRGLIYWSSGLVYVAADQPADPVKLVTAANVIDGTFNYEGTSLKARHTVVSVTWFDPDDACKPAIEFVVDRDQVAKYGWRVTDVTAFACTSRGQAHRLGKWILDTERYATETVNYIAGFDHADVMPGDIIEVYDANKALLRFGGRLIASSSNSITIDKAITIEAGKTYTLKVALPDGTLASRVLTNSAGVATVLTFTTALAATPVSAAIWGVTVSDLAPRQFRVLSVKELAAGRFSVSATFHDPNKYARVENNVKFDPISFTRIPKAKPTAPTDMAISEYLYRSGPTVLAAATLTWQPPFDASSVQSYEVQRRRSQSNWESLGVTNATSFDVRGAESGLWAFRVRSINYNGLSSEWFEKEAVLFGLSAAPADVQNFFIYVNGNTSTLVWDAVADLDLSHYRIKFAPVLTGATWGTAIDVSPKITGLSVQLPSQVGTYLIKAVDLSANESTNAAAIVTSVASLSGLNAVAAISDWPNWLGTHGGTIVDGNDLKLGSPDTWASLPAWQDLGSWNYLVSGVAGTGTYTLASSLDLGAVYTSRLNALIDAYGLNIANTWGVLGTWASLGAWSPVAPDSWGVQLQIRTTNDDPAGSPVWSAWKNLVAGDYTARAFQFRLLLSSSDINVTPVVNDATITVDMPDRVEGKNNVTVPVGGVTVTFGKAFRATPAIALTGQNLQTGDYPEYTAGPSANGFSMIWKNSAGAAVSRQMDWIAQGYGIVN